MFRTVSVVGALLVGLCLPSARAQTPFGGDDTGFIPPAADAKCEAGAAKAADKLIACILMCHASRVSGKLADDTAENACETGLAGKSCFASFTLAISMLKGCPSCINGTTMANLANLTEGLIDGNNSTIYCGGSTTTTTIPCLAEGTPCGSCGNGVCARHCGPSGPLVCANKATASGPCGFAFNCGPGRLCVSFTTFCSPSTCAEPCP